MRIKSITFRWKREGGYALVVVLLVITVFSILGLAVIYTAFNHTKQFSKETTKTQALNVAEMGLKAYTKQVNSNLSSLSNVTADNFKNDLSGALPSSMNSSSDATLSTMQGSPSYTVTRGSVDEPSNNQISVTITSHGTSGSEIKTITQRKTFTFQSSSNVNNGDADHTPPYMGLSLPYMEGSFIHQGNYYCNNNNIYINGSTTKCAGDTQRAVNLSKIKTLFQEMPLSLPSSNPISDAPTLLNGDNFTQSRLQSSANFPGQLNIQSIDPPSIFDGNLNIGMQYGGQLNIENESTFNGDIYINGQVNIKKDTTFNGNVFINGQLHVEQGVNATFNGYVRVNQQIDLKNDSYTVFSKNTYISGQGNDKGKVNYVGNVYFDGDLNSGGGDTYQGYVFINGSNNRSDDSAGWNESVNFNRTVYINNNFYPKSNKSAINFSQGVVVVGESSPNTSANGKITIGPQLHGGTTGESGSGGSSGNSGKSPITVINTKTNYQ